MQNDRSTTLLATPGIGLTLGVTKLAICENSIAVNSLQSLTGETTGTFRLGNVTGQTFGDHFAQPYRNGIAN